jgi:septal ring factor EnvC (AmiA/AmiB activator)
MLQYQSKKKRVRDPNLPPPPTLLGQVKELRLTREQIESVETRIAELENENRNLQFQITDLTFKLNRLTRQIKNGKKS